MDIDDVICLNAPYGGYDVLVDPQPNDLWEKLFSLDAKSLLLEVIREHHPRVVLTTSWLRFLDRKAFEQMFHATGLGPVAECLHPHWDAPQTRGTSRLLAIEQWLEGHHDGEQFVVLDDHLSGTDLAGSRIDKAGNLVLCVVGVGLQAAHLDKIRKAFSA